MVKACVKMTKNDTSKKVEPASNNNINKTTSDDTLMFIENYKHKSRLLIIQSMCKDPKCEELHKGIVSAAIMPGVAREDAPIASEGPKNDDVNFIIACAIKSMEFSTTTKFLLIVKKL